MYVQLLETNKDDKLCEEREKTNKMQQSDVYYQLLSQHVSAIIMPIFKRTKTYVTACGVLRWFCWMWLVAVVGRCVVGCEHCEGYCSTVLRCRVRAL